MARKAVVDHPVVQREEIDRRVDSLASEVAGIVSLHREALGVDEEFSPSPELDLRLRAGLKAALESEFTPAVAAGDGRINQFEFDREIIKKALVGLTRHQLQLLGKERRVRVSGSAEALASRVADSFDWDPVEVAKAVLRYELATSTDRGHATRIFALAEEPAMDHVRERLSYVAGRYIKVALAKWFVFDSVKESPDSVVLAGALRSFKAEVEAEEDGTAAIHHIGDRKEALIEFSGGQLFQVNESTVLGSRAGAEAFSQAINIQLLDWVPNGGTGAPAGTSGSVGMHPTSEFVMDIVHNRLRDGRFSDMNLTGAKFQVGRESKDTTVERKPELKSVRFDGSYLIGSHSACTMLVTDRRALVDIAFQVAVRAKDGTDRGSFPVRLSVESNHVLVATGYGSSGDVATSREVHLKAVRAVEQEMVSGLGNESRLNDLVTELRAVAAKGTADKAVPLGG